MRSTVRTLTSLVIAVTWLAAAADASSATYLGKPGLIAYLRGYDIWVAQPDGRNARQLTNTAANKWTNEDASFSADGKQIAFTSNRNGNSDIYVMNADGTGLRRVTTHAAKEFKPTWSPDGKQLAFISMRSGAGEVYRVKSTVPYGNAVKLAAAYKDSSGDSHWYVDVEWHPTLQQLLVSDYSSSNGYPLARLISSADGHALSGVVYITEEPSWAPRGRAVAYQDSDGGTQCNNWFIVTSKPDGTQRRYLTPYEDCGAYSTNPVWSPDGTKIAYQCAVNCSPVGAYVMNADGTNKRKLPIPGQVMSWQAVP